MKTTIIILVAIVANAMSAAGAWAYSRGVTCRVGPADALETFSWRSSCSVFVTEGVNRRTRQFERSAVNRCELPNPYGPRSASIEIEIVNPDTDNAYLLVNNGAFTIKNSGKGYFPLQTSTIRLRGNVILGCSTFWSKE